MANANPSERVIAVRILSRHLYLINQRRAHNLTLLTVTDLVEGRCVVQTR
jgi:hypothetical protein